MCWKKPWATTWAWRYTVTIDGAGPDTAGIVKRKGVFMRKYRIPQIKKQRVIINTDAKNEVDDQFAIVHALLTESFDIRGLIAAHFGVEKSAASMMDSYHEIQHLMDLMGCPGLVPVKKGAEKALPDENTPEDSEGARLIIEEAMKDEGPLYLAFLGAITDMASAILLEPRILEKDIKVIWIGGGNYPEGCWEYNLGNDIAAANVVFRSGVEVWQIPRNVYRMMPVSFAELNDRVAPCGKVGAYLAENVIRFNNEDAGRPTEYRVLGDSPAIGVLMYEDCGVWQMVRRPLVDADMSYSYREELGQIRVYRDMNSRFILEDMYAKLKDFAADDGTKE